MSTSTFESTAGSPRWEEDSLYEVIDGRRVEKVMGYRQVLLANRLARSINIFAAPLKLGFAVVEPLIDLGLPGSPQFRPDMAFLSEQTWPFDRDEPTSNSWPVVPDLAVEVVSPSNSAEEIHSKIHAYFQAGVGRVIVIYLKIPAVQVYDSPTAVRILSPADDLDGGEVIPGYRIPLSSLFRGESDRS